MIACGKDFFTFKMREEYLINCSLLAPLAKQKDPSWVVLSMAPIKVIPDGNSILPICPKGYKGNRFGACVPLRSNIWNTKEKVFKVYGFIK